MWGKFIRPKAPSNSRSFWIPSRELHLVSRLRSGCDAGREQPGHGTCQYGASLALLLHTTLPLPGLSEGHFKHEAADVMGSFKLRFPFLQFFFIKERDHVGHLDICVLGIQILRVDL